MLISNVRDVYLERIKTEKDKKIMTMLLRSSFKDYITFISPFVLGFEFIFKPFHDEIIQSLQDLVDGIAEKPNIMLNLPVGSGKSLLIELFITWSFARNINAMFLYSSHRLDLISDMSAETRNIIMSDIYFRLFDIKLKMDDKSKMSYSFEGSDLRTGLEAMTIGAGITGVDAGNPNTEGYMGALIMDDLIDAMKVRSEVERQENIDTYENKLKTRKRHPMVSEIIVGQRLDLEDIYGYIEKHYADDFKIIKVKALNDNDTSFWEERKPAKMLLELRDKSPDPTTFASQYQQEPINRGGQVIDIKWFKEYQLKELNDIKFDKTFIVGDTAQKTKEANDFSVFTVWGLRKVDGQTRLYLLDGIRGKWEAPQLLEKAGFIYGLWRNRFNNRRCSGLYIEDKSSGIGLLQQLRQLQKIPVMPLKTKQKDKLTRLEDVLHYIYVGSVYLPVDLPFSQELKNECQLFSRDMSHKHDDIVDTLIYACQVSFLPGNATIFDGMMG